MKTIEQKTEGNFELKVDHLDDNGLYIGIRVEA